MVEGEIHIVGGFDDVLGKGLVFRGSVLEQLLQDFGRHLGLVGHIQAHHGDVKAGLEDDVRSFGVAEDVGLAHGQNVAPLFIGAAHEDHVFHHVGKLRLLLQGQGQVGHAAQSDDGQLPAVLFGHLDDEVLGLHVQGLLVRFGDLHAADAVGAVDVVLRAMPVTKQGLVLAHHHGDLVAGVGHFDQAQAVFCTLGGGGVSEAGGDAHYPDIGVLEGVINSDGIIDAGICVNEEFQHKEPPCKLFVIIIR